MPVSGTLRSESHECHTSFHRRPAAHVPRAARGRVLRHSQSVGPGHRALSAKPGLQGARDDELGLRVDARAAGQRHHARGGARAPRRHGRRDRSAGERRLRGRLRGGCGRRGGKRAPCRRDRRRRAVDRGLDRRCGAAAPRVECRRRTDARGAPRDRQGGRRHAPRRARRMLPRRPSRTSPRRSRDSRPIRTRAPIASTRPAFARASRSRPWSRPSRRSPSIC